MHKLILSAAAIAFVAVNCGENKGQPSLDSAKFTYVKGDVSVGGAPAALGNTVAKDAVIEVKANSMAVLQFANAATITLKANSQLSIANLAKGENGKPVIELSQSSGTSFSKIAKGRSEYSIKTPTAVAGVRGTSFELTVDKTKATQIRLLEGKVQVAKPEATREELANATVVEAGQKIEATRRGVTQPVEITETEKTSLKAMNTVEIAPAGGKAIIAESVEKYATGVSTSAAATEVATPQNRKLTLNDIKAKYGRIAKIETKNGKTYTGYFNQAGNTMTIQTVDGQVSLPVANVNRIMEIK